MVDIDKRCFKPWPIHDSGKLLKSRFCETYLPQIKHAHSIKNLLERPAKRNVSQLLPAITRNTLGGSALFNVNLTESFQTNSAAREAAQRFILRNNLGKISPEPSTAHVTHSSYPRRKTLYDHVQPKIDTGRPRVDTKESCEPSTHQLEPSRPVNWSALKHEIEQDVHIRAQSNRLQFNSGVTYSAQLTNLGNLIRSKIKTHLTSTNGSGDERYKIVVHLTVFSTSTACLHVASRCLWNKKTDNSITIKMQGIDCDILIVAFLCYTDLGA